MSIFQRARFAPMAAAAMILIVSVPTQASSQDDRITAAAMNSYNFKTFLKDDAIRVETDHGQVTLSGTVSADYHKALAEDTVSGLPGVKRVSNQLVVSGAQPAERTDPWITLKVKAALTFHARVSAVDTRVQTQDGVVTLTGQARSEAQKELTAEYAKEVEGVQSVRNELVVVPDRQPLKALAEKVDDASITAQVKTSLLLHKATRVLATRVLTRNGAVTVKGEARNEAERELVTRLASDIKGVKEVRNRMTVQKS